MSRCLCPRAVLAILSLWPFATTLANGFGLRAPPKTEGGHLDANDDSVFGAVDDPLSSKDDDSDDSVLFWRAPTVWNGSGMLRAVYDDNQSADWLSDSMASPVMFTMVLCNNMKPAGTSVSGYVGCMPHSRGCFMASPIQSPSCSMGLMSVNRLMEDHYETMRINFTHLNSSRWEAEWGELVPKEDTVASTGLPRRPPRKLVYVAVLDGVENHTRVSFHDGCTAGRRALGLRRGRDGEGALSFACSEASLEVWRSGVAVRRRWVSAHLVAWLFSAYILTWCSLSTAL